MDKPVLHPYEGDLSIFVNRIDDCLNDFVAASGRSIDGASPHEEEFNERG